MSASGSSRLGGRHAGFRSEDTTKRLPNLRFILNGNKRGLAIISAFALITAFSEAFLLAAVVQSLSVISGGGTSVGLDVGPVSARVDVTTLLTLAVAAAFVRGGCVAVIAFFGPRIAASSRERHRRTLFQAYLSADWSTQSADKTGRFLQTLSSAVNDANTIVSLAAQALPALLTLIVLVGLSFILSPAVTVVLVGLGVLIALVLRPISSRAYRAARADAAGRNATASHVAGVIAAGSEVAVLGSRQGVVDVGFERVGAAERAYAKAQGLQRLVSMAGQSIAFLLAAGGLLVLSVSDWDVNFATVGTIAVLLIRGAGLAQQVQSASTQYGAITPFIHQVRTLIEHYQAHCQTYGTDGFPINADIAIRGVEYVYPGTTRTAVHVEQAFFPHGSSTGVVGPSGSGKSTLIQLILRLRPPTSGEVSFGSTNAQAITDAAFTANVAYVPQAPHLVPGTIADNIRFFRKGVTEAQVEEAARRAHIHDDILRMPQGYDTVLDAHVDTLSGGQKQRLALARALTCHPAVLVLDEPTSALDAASEAAVMDTLGQLRGRTTVIMITHKASTLAHCDSVLSLESGMLRKCDGSEMNGQSAST